MKKPKTVNGLDKSIHVHQNAKIEFDLKINQKFQLTPNQEKFLEIVSDKKTKIVLVQGPAGSSKSYIAIYAALLALKNKKISELHYWRNPVESSNYALGFLPGLASDKIKPYLMPLEAKCLELISAADFKRLEKEERVKGQTIGFIRGASINASYIFVDEASNLTVNEFLTCMTRIGKFSTMIFAGDKRQIDCKNSGFEKVFALFDNEESKEKGIITFKFGREDIVREEIISYILDKFEILGK